MAQSTSGGPFRCGGTMEFSASYPFPVPNPACKHAIAGYETQSAALPASQRVILPHFFADFFVRRFGIPGRAHAALDPAPRGMRVQRRPGAVPVQNQAGGGGCCRRPVRRIVPPAEVVLDHHAPRAAAAGLADEPVPARQPGQGAPALSCWCLSSSRVCGRPRVVERGRGRLVRLFRIVRLAALGDRRLRPTAVLLGCRRQLFGVSEQIFEVRRPLGPELPQGRHEAQAVVHDAGKAPLKDFRIVAPGRRRSACLKCLVTAS